MQLFCRDENTIIRETVQRPLA